MVAKSVMFTSTSQPANKENALGANVAQKTVNQRNACRWGSLRYSQCMASTNGLDPEVLARLTSLRESIDNVDAALIHMLAERFKFTQAVGRLKAANEMPPSDPEREKRQVERLRALAAEANLDPEFAEKWFNFVVEQVIKHHVEIRRVEPVETAQDS